MSPAAGGDGPVAAANDSPVVAALTELSARLADGSDFDELEGPIYWPTRDPELVEFDWPSLAAWVRRLRARFPHLIARIPDCWYRHNDLVEALLALRDCERACYTASSPASAAVEWHRAFRDMEARWDGWIKRFTCTVPGKGHPPADPGPQQADAEFAAFIEDDLARRATNGHNDTQASGGANRTSAPTQ